MLLRPRVMVVVMMGTRGLMMASHDVGTSKQYDVGILRRCTVILRFHGCAMPPLPCPPPPSVILVLTLPYTAFL